MAEINEFCPDRLSEMVDCWISTFCLEKSMFHNSQYAYTLHSSIHFNALQTSPESNFCKDAFMWTCSHKHKHKHKGEESMKNI